MNDLNNLSLEKIKKWFQKISHGKVSYSKEGIKPTNDWDIIIAIVAVIFCLEAALAFFIYFQIQSGSWFQDPQTNSLTEISINQNLLQKITGQIDDKSAIYSATSTSQVVSDPSL
jgi:hypothetical protein